MTSRRRHRQGPARPTRLTATTMALAVALGCLVLAACGGGSRTAETPSSGGAATVAPRPSEGSATVTPAPGANDAPADGRLLTVTLRLMTYNVLWGGGVDREFDFNVADRYRVDRLDDILEVVREVGPDLLAIQEAAGWDRGSPSLAERVAQRLGMYQVLARDGSDLNVVLFSRFPIADAQFGARLSDDFYSGFNGVLLRATVLLADDAKLTVYVPHLNSQSSAVRSCQVESLLRLSRARSNGASVLLGDLNSRPTSVQGNAMTAAGWQFLGAESTWTVDQVWAGPGVVFRSPRVFTTSASRALSDHLPAAVEVTLDVPRGGQSPAVPSSAAGRLEDACPPPTPAPVSGR